ncbi:hypothetical protein H6F77_11775 [Microcoleus sp. FACHB-831]|uniref:hypothetical protein n=1 Tax=Microcoleus sp. FACHB-831 TaxID=2692827 RepID=UPI0016829070|nr:hypothetical protein [Microcoleus sp. FACHB-831]MBD1921770.1 hypothetical protein [Microcoleus sp. FACHB-831]
MFSRSKLPATGVQRIIFVAVAICLLIGLGSLWALSQNEQATSWVRANQVVPDRVLAAAVQENYTRAESEKPLNTNQIKAFKVPSLEKDNLYIIDFNTPQLCGKGGCLYSVYTDGSRLTLSLMLNPNLPKAISLFSISEQARNGFPCLVIAQSAGKENTVFHSRYCYEGTGFTLVNFSNGEGT